jgi:hypothetical protein
MTKVTNEIVERDGGRAYRFGEPFKRLSEDHMRRFMRTLYLVRGHLLALGMAVALSTPGSVLAQDKPAKVLESAGVLAFGPDNVLFVGDTKGAAVHAFELRPADITPQTNVSLGNARTFEGRDLIGGIDRKLAALLGTSADQIVINGLVVHRPSKQIFLSVHRGRGPDAIPVIVKVNDGRLEVLDLDKLSHSMIRIADVPGQETLEFGQRERSLAITDITYYQGEIFVAGVSNEEFASKLRRIRYPFNDSVSTSSIEIWHSVHAEFETRAPIIKQLVREIGGVPYLVAVYACTPLVRIPVAALQNGARVQGETIGELGYGNTPIDMVSYVDATDGKEYLLVTNNSRNATRIAVGDIGQTTPMPVNVSNNFGPAGIAQFPIPLTGVLHLDLLDEQWAVVIRRPPADDQRVDLHTLPLPFFFDRADQIVEMNWPGAPDPFGYHSVGPKQ